MDVAQRDLSAYQLARQLHLLPQLREVFRSHSLAHPLFLGCLDPRAKSQARLILLCMQRCLSGRAAMQSTPLPTRDQRLLMRLILSYVDLSHLPPVPAPQSSLLSVSRRQSVAAAVTHSTAPQSPDRVSQRQTPLQPLESTAPQSPLVPLHLDSTPGRDSAAATESAFTSATAPGAAAVPPSPQRPDHNLYRPVFTVRPVPPSHAVGQERHGVYARMVHTIPLNEESLNPFFGRYGQVGCELLRSVRLAEGAYLSSEMVYGLAEAFACTPQDLVLYDFIVSMDSSQNASHAVSRAYYKELLFIALHDETTNAFCIADLDALLCDTTAVYLRTEGHLEDTIAKRKRKRSRFRSGLAEVARSSCSSSSSSEDDTSFSPDIAVSGFPYWTTEDQLKVLFQEYGTVQSMRMSIDDLSGAFAGVVLVCMTTLEEALRLSDRLNGTKYKGSTLVSGVLNEQLEIVSLRDESEVRQSHDRVPAGYDIRRNPRLWV